jgi:AcrR family transcriptional regulator
MQKRLKAADRRGIIEEVALEIFAKKGYLATSIDVIAKTAGVSAPVVYDHFKSKSALHRHLLKRHFAELRASWHDELAGDYSVEQRLSKSIDAWLAYVQSHPLACQFLFRSITEDPAAEAERRKMAMESWGKVLAILPGKLKLNNLNSSSAKRAEMFFEVLRTGLHGLALWWLENPEVPRSEVLRTAMNLLWIGLERVQKGETWNEK